MFEKVFGLAPVTWAVIAVGAILVGLIAYGMPREPKSHGAKTFLGFDIPAWGILVSCSAIIGAAAYEVHLVSLW